MHKKDLESYEKAALDALKSWLHLHTNGPSQTQIVAARATLEHVRLARDAHMDEPINGELKASDAQLRHILDRCGSKTCAFFGQLTTYLSEKGCNSFTIAALSESTGTEQKRLRAVLRALGRSLRNHNCPSLFSRRNRKNPDTDKTETIFTISDELKNCLIKYFE